MTDPSRNPSFWSRLTRRLDFMASGIEPDVYEVMARRIDTLERRLASVEAELRTDRPSTGDGA